MDCGAPSLAMVMLQFGVYRDIAERRARIGQTGNGRKPTLRSSVTALKARIYF